MTRSQALTIGVLAGFVMLACAGMVVMLRLPLNRLLPPTATLAPPSPLVTPTATFPVFLPTAALQTTAPAEPSPTNTRVPTSTPTPPKSPTPTVVIKLPTRRPTATPTPSPTISLPPTRTPTPLPAPTTPPRQYSLYFSADDETLTKGDCTDLEWRVTGAVAVWLDGRSVAPDDSEEVCPKKDTSYELTVELPEMGQRESRTVEIEVKEKDETDD